jgi:hypothetical protein
VSRKKKALIIVGTSGFIGATASAVATCFLIPHFHLFFLLFCYIGALGLLALALYSGSRML